MGVHVAICRLRPHGPLAAVVAPVGGGDTNLQHAAGDFQLTDVYTRTLAPGDYPNINLLADAVMTQLQNAMDNYCAANAYANAVFQNETVSELDGAQRITRQLHLTAVLPPEILRVQVLFPKVSPTTGGILDTHHLLGGRVDLEDESISRTTKSSLMRT